MAEPHDSVVRAISRDQAFRVMVARTTRTVRTAVRIQQGSGSTARNFGDLLTGAILFRETMAPGLRVQAILRGVDGQGTLVADSHPSGAARGLIQPAAGQNAVVVGRGALLQMMRTLHDGRINQGVVNFPEGGTLSDALMHYMQESEQVVTMLAVATLLEDDAVTRAGGYLLQLLPDAPRGAVAIMTERLEEFRDVSPQLAHPEFTPDGLLSELLHGIEFDRLEENTLRFECWCSELRVVSALSTLDRGELSELIVAGEPLEISCDYCGRDYRIPTARLQGLLERS